MVGRSVVETLKVVHESQSDVERVVDIIERTAKDSGKSSTFTYVNKTILLGI